MQTGLSELRQICKPLALASAFETPEVQDRLSCVWLLALELDKAVLLPKESMLRLIRLQWWCDALETGRDHNVPLMRDLLDVIAAGKLDKSWLLDLIQNWQIISDRPEALSQSWEALLIKISGKDTQAIRDCGHNLFCALQRRPDMMRPLTLKSSDLSGNHRYLLKACGYLTKRGEVVDISEDGTLGFRLFIYLLFGRVPV